MTNLVSYRAGEVIIAEGASTSEAYILDRGTVEVYLKGPPEQRLRVLQPGDVFGEMALITERPRSASVRALEDIDARVIERDEFLSTWRSDPDLLLPVLSGLCERVRTLTGLVAELARHSPDSRDIVRSYIGGEDAPDLARPLSAATTEARLEGATDAARDSLGGRRMRLDRFPFRIGRATKPPDPLSPNDLTIADREPYRVSRTHCLIVPVADRWFLIDRGSHLGTIVNGTVIGGGKHTGRIQLWDGRNELELGGASTPYRFWLTIAPRG